MTKRIVSLLLVILLCAALAVTAFAADADKRFVYDDADLLQDFEEEALESKLSTLSRTYEAQIVVATVASIDGEDVDTYVASYYEDMGFGYGQDRDGILLLVCMDLREYRILRNGLAYKAISGRNADQMGQAIAPDLTDGNYLSAFETFADECQYYLDGHINGYPFKFVRNLVIALAIGLVVALIVTGIWRGQLKSVRKQRQADVYVKTGSLQITQSGDFFMYRNVTRTEKPKSNISSSGSGGGSRGISGGSF